jgi:hypothetical protein
VTSLRLVSSESVHVSSFFSRIRLPGSTGGCGGGGNGFHGHQLDHISSYHLNIVFPTDIVDHASTPGNLPKTESTSILNTHTNSSVNKKRHGCLRKKLDIIIGKINMTYYTIYIQYESCGEKAKKQEVYVFLGKKKLPLTVRLSTQ